MLLDTHALRLAAGLYLACMHACAAQGRCNSDPNARSVTIMITDCCPECEADHIDIQALTFNKMAPMALGRIDIKFRRYA